MKLVCPYCNQPVAGLPLTIPVMRYRWRRVYLAVVKAGVEGIETEDLLVRMYADDEMPTAGGWTVLRGVVHGINKLIEPEPYRQRITGWPRGRYRLVSLREVEDVAKEVQSQGDTQGRYSDKAP